MIHYVTPQRSDDPATTPAADPSPPPRLGAGDAPPGPISWELPVAGAPPQVEPADGVRPAEISDPQHGTSWDAVPHPVGPIPEPRPAADQSATAGLSARRQPPRPAVPEPAQARLATTVHSLGPVGRRRSTVVAFLLAVLTLGLHPIAWVRRANAEMNHFDPRMVVRPARSAGALAAVALLPLAAAAAEAVRIAVDHLGSAPNLPLAAQTSRWLLLAPALTPLLAVLVPFSLVAVTMTIERVRVVEDRAGVDPDQQVSPARLVWWTAVPVVGLAIVVARAQARLNRVWAGCAAPTER